MEKNVYSPADHARLIVERGYCIYADVNETRTVEKCTCQLMPKLKGDKYCTAEDYKTCPVIGGKR